MSDPISIQIAGVFNLSRSKKILVVTDWPEGAPDIRIGDRILVRSAQGLTAMAEIAGFELITFRDPTTKKPGQFSIWIHWEGSEIADPELEGASFSKIEPP